MTKSNAQRQSEWRARRQAELVSLRALPHEPIPKPLTTDKAITGLTDGEFAELTHMLARIRSQAIHAAKMKQKADDIKILLSNIVT